MADALTAIRSNNASDQSLADINELIVRSKAHWCWPDGYLTGRTDRWFSSRWQSH
jgi:hypothetical protein